MITRANNEAYSRNDVLQVYDYETGKVTWMIAESMQRWAQSKDDLDVGPESLRWVATALPALRLLSEVSSVPIYRRLESAVDTHLVNISLSDFIKSVCLEVKGESEHLMSFRETPQHVRSTWTAKCDGKPCVVHVMGSTHVIIDQKDAVSVYGWSTMSRVEPERADLSFYGLVRAERADVEGDDRPRYVISEVIAGVVVAQGRRAVERLANSGYWNESPFGNEGALSRRVVSIGGEPVSSTPADAAPPDGGVLAACNVQPGKPSFDHSDPLTYSLLMNRHLAIKPVAEGVPAPSHARALLDTDDGDYQPALLSTIIQVAGAGTPSAEMGTTLTRISPAPEIRMNVAKWLTPRAARDMMSSLDDSISVEQDGDEDQSPYELQHIPTDGIVFLSRADPFRARRIKPQSTVDVLMMENGVCCASDHETSRFCAQLWGSLLDHDSAASKVQGQVIELPVGQPVSTVKVREAPALSEVRRGVGEFGDIGSGLRLRNDRTVANSPDVIDEAIAASEGSYRRSDGRAGRGQSASLVSAAMASFSSSNVIMEGAEALGKFTLVGVAQRFESRIRQMLASGSSIIRGSLQASVQIGVSLVITVDCACGRSRMIQLFERAVEASFTSRVPHLHINVDVSGAEMMACPAFNQEPSSWILGVRSLHALMKKAMEEPGSMVVGWRCDYGQRFLFELVTAASTFEGAPVIKCCAATLNGAAHFLVPIWMQGRNVPVPLTLRGIDASTLNTTGVQAGSVYLRLTGDGYVEYSSAQIKTDTEPALSSVDAFNHGFCCTSMGEGQSEVRITPAERHTFEVTWPREAH